MAMRPEVSESSVSSLTVRIPKVGSLLSEVRSYGENLGHQFCGGKWSVAIVTSISAIGVRVMKEGYSKVHLHKNVVQIQLSMVREDEREYHLYAEKFLFHDENQLYSSFEHKQLEFPGFRSNPSTADDLKITCNFKCFECEVEAISAHRMENLAHREQFTKKRKFEEEENTNLQRKLFRPSERKHSFGTASPNPNSQPEHPMEVQMSDE